MAAMAGSASPEPPSQASKLNNTSFLLTRLTPLYNLNTSRLTHYAREFRDIVRGDVIRGVQTSAAISDRAKSALIRSCDWTIENDLIPTESFDSLVVKVTWDDGSSFVAILIPNFTASETVTLGKRKRGSTTDTTEFTPLPLLLTRGPQLVTQQFIKYVTTRFDSRASEINFPVAVLEDCLQGYLERVFQEDSPPRVIERRLRLLELQFSTPQPKDTKVKGALRKITLNFVSPDVQELYRRSPTIMESLTKHVRASTAISLSALTLTRITCAGIIFDASGRLKIFENAGTEGLKFIVGKVVAFAGKDNESL